MKKVHVFLSLIIFFHPIIFAQPASSHSKLQFVTKEINRIAIGSTYSYHFNAVDSFDHPFVYAVSDLPRWMRYDSTKHAISGKPVKPGQYPVHIIASNKDTIVHQIFMLTVFNKQTMNILCLGNSITNGTATYNSYRRDLWKLLHAGNYNFDMIGSWSSHHMGGAVPNPDFDMDHDGHSGWTAANILHPPDWDIQRGDIHQWLHTYTPDIVLLELGTNEVFQCVPAIEALENISAIIDSLRAKNERVKVFLAQIPPLGEQWAPKKLCGNDTAYAQRVIEFNQEIKKFAMIKNSSASPVIVVDQYTGIAPAKNMYDDIHPNDSGEKIMAERWFAAIRIYLKKL